MSFSITNSKKNQSQLGNQLGFWIVPFVKFHIYFVKSSSNWTIIKIYIFIEGMWYLHFLTPTLAGLDIA